ncbi:hypothetical protein ACIHAX_28050 [Nocardia sp. NPDC051929]|uniref:hypothetical protein n=1 Tax=Nocardia sp. NPDC051929 TaxID=3364327 RepID=UPI0037C5ACAD
MTAVPGPAAEPIIDIDIDIDIDRGRPRRRSRPPSRAGGRPPVDVAAQALSVPHCNGSVRWFR